MLSRLNLRQRSFTIPGASNIVDQQLGPMGSESVISDRFIVEHPTRR
jgi:hypothetical protein